MPEIQGLAHFSIPVTDTKRSQKFYEDVLGMTAVQVNHERGMGRNRPRRGFDVSDRGFYPCR